MIKKSHYLLSSFHWPCVRHHTKWFIHFSAHHRFEVDITTPFLILNKKIEVQGASFAQDHTAGKWWAKNWAEAGHLGESLYVVSSLALLDPGKPELESYHELRLQYSGKCCWPGILLTTCAHSSTAECSRPSVLFKAQCFPFFLYLNHLNYYLLCILITSSFSLPVDQPDMG